MQRRVEAMASMIARMWADRCEKNIRNTNEVPVKLKSDVLQLIAEHGFIVEEDGTCSPATNM